MSNFDFSNLSSNNNNNDDKDLLGSVNNFV